MTAAPTNHANSATISPVVPHTLVRPSTTAPIAITKTANTTVTHAVVTPSTVVAPMIKSTVPPTLSAMPTTTGPVLRKTVVATAPIAVHSSSMTTKSKSKKKKSQSVSLSAAGANVAGENTGRWTAEEHRLFLQGLEQHGKGWKKIASLIKSRTVVQIRTHAQKYFQKLAKARQNGEEGDVAMDSRGTSAIGIGMSTASATSKRRRQMSGTKRKAISSVVSSVTREGKRQQAAQQASGNACPVPPLPAVAPALAPFVIPSAQAHASGTTTPTTLPSSAHGAISGPAMEDSLFRFLSPAPVIHSNDTIQVNDVARQAGANPITVPSDSISAPLIAGEVSPTCVTDVAIFPSWTDAKDMPSWYAKGADVDVLLDAADGLDWLTDTGDLHETYEPPAGSVVPRPAISANNLAGSEFMKANSVTNLTTDALTGDTTSGDVPQLPSLFDTSSDPDLKKQKLVLSTSATGIDESLDVFDTPMEEHAFVSALLENNGESSNSLPILQ